MRRLRWFLVASGLAIYVLVAARCAWQSDDAYIGFRTVANLVNGRGLVWNVGERVQAFTNTLWILLVSMAFAVTGEVYYTSLVLSLGLSALALGVIAIGLARSILNVLLVFALALSSKSLIDYSTSGLENPLGHVLIAAACLVLLTMAASPRRVLALSLLASLSALNRPDSLLLVAPMLAVAFVESPDRRKLATVVIGMLPLVAWEVFSVAYYGSLVPNTAHAKLSVGAGRSALIVQGLNYIRNSLTLDLVTLVSIGIAVVFSLIRGGRRQHAIATGILAYLAYVVWIGGDFMSGRFFSIPFVAALALIADRPTGRPVALTCAATALTVSLASPWAPLLSGPAYGRLDRSNIIDQFGISDERAFYYPWTGLLVARPHKAESFHPWAHWGRRLVESGQTVAVEGNIGFLGFFAGPAVYIINPHGLSDALLGRMPVISYRDWRIGHLERAIPVGYVETKAGGSGRLVDADLRRFNDRLQFVIAGPLWDRRRVSAAVRLALGLDGLPASLRDTETPRWIE